MVGRAQKQVDVMPPPLHNSRVLFLASFHVEHCANDSPAFLLAQAQLLPCLYNTLTISRPIKIVKIDRESRKSQAQC
jgi:hypothetical protein